MWRRGTATEAPLIDLAVLANSEWRIVGTVD